MNHLAGKVRLKNQQKSIYSKSCQDIIELCEIRDGLSSCDTLSNFRWEDAKRAYLKFIDNEIITRHITRNPCTLRYTYSYTLIYTKTHRIYTKLMIDDICKIIDIICIE